MVAFGFWLICLEDSFEFWIHPPVLKRQILASAFLGKARPSLSVLAISTRIRCLFMLSLKWQQPQGDSSPAGCCSAANPPQTVSCQSAAVIMYRMSGESVLAFTISRQSWSFLTKQTCSRNDPLEGLIKQWDAICGGHGDERRVEISAVCRHVSQQESWNWRNPPSGNGQEPFSQVRRRSDQPLLCLWFVWAEKR